MERTIKGGGEIVALLKTGSAFYAPSAAIVKMVRSILRDERRLVCAAAYLEGEYGFNGIYLGVPVILGKDGVEEIVTLPLSDASKKKLQSSADMVAESYKTLESKLVP